MKHDLPVFALLIDADNVGKETIAPIIEEVTREARIAVRRIYGDFTTPQLASWRETLANHGIHPIQQYRNSVGKNASDSALIIDAMDLLHSGRFQGFCLVSSDSDFTRLATRIREDGLAVFGFGRKSTPKAFVNACERYIYVENLLNPPELPRDDESSIRLETKDAFPPAKPAVSADESKPQAIKAAQPADIVKLKSLLLRAYSNVSDEDGWALLSRVSQHLRANHSDFDPRNYGTTTFTRLLDTLGSFEVIQRKQGNGHAHFCRPQKREMRADYIEALKSAVEATRSADGWSGLPAIGAHLRVHGHSLAESGCASLTEALHASGLFDMRDAGGIHKDFRLNGPTS